MTEIICQCIADAYVAQSGGGYNTAELKAEENGDDKYILVGFQLPSDIDPATIEKIELEMYIKDYGGDYDWEGADYYQDTLFFNALPPFSEYSVNWLWHFNNSIYLGQDVLKTPIKKNAYYPVLNVGMEYPDLLEPLLSHLTADKKLYFSWKGSDTWQTFSSRTGGNPPILIITTVTPVCPEGAYEVLEYCPDGITEKRWRDCINNEWIEDSQSCPICTEGAHEVLEYCPDGVTEKRWRDCVNNEWVEDSQDCPVPPICTEGAHEVLEYCPDGVTEKRWRDCSNNTWTYGELIDCQVPPICTEGAHEVLEYCPDGVTEKRWRDCSNNTWAYGELIDCPVPPICTEGAHEVLEYCPDGVTEKRWRDCSNNTWAYNEQECPFICPEGSTACKVYDLYECINGEYVLIERNSSECGYKPEPPFPPCPFMCVCMGTPLVDCLEPLRVFRDKVLKKTKLGRDFVSFYYNRLTPFLSPIILKIRGIDCGYKQTIRRER